MTSATSYLQGAHHLQIEHITIAHSVRKTGKSALEYLQDHIAVGAIHSSDERCADIMNWITHGQRDAQPMRLMWPSGPAGSGKTAIAGSIAELCAAEEILAGSFFFSSYSASQERGSKRCLVPTLVYQRLQHEGLEVMEDLVARAIQRDPAIFRKRLKDQFEALILKPLRKVRAQLGPDIPQAIIIGGVDEVKVEGPKVDSHHTAPRRNEDDHLEIVACLLHAAWDPAFPFRIVIVSLPERVFTDFFSTQAGGLSKQLFLDENYDPDSDIRLYLMSKFAELRRRYGLSLSWPSEGVVERIVRKASGQFVYAATVIRFVVDGENPPPAQLDALFHRDLRRSVGSGTGLSSLYALYADILMSSPNPRLAAEWILAIAHLSASPARLLRIFLESETGQWEHVLGPLASLIYIPDSANEHEEPPRIYHKSLLDFTFDEERCLEALGAGGEDAESLNIRAVITRAWVSLTKDNAHRASLLDIENSCFIADITPPAIACRIACVLRPFDTFDEADFVTCDVYWWASRVLGRDLGLWVHLARFAVLCPVLSVHQKCRELCRRWSRDIFQAFVDNGWTVPCPSLWLGYAAEQDDGRRAHFMTEIHRALKPESKPALE